MVGARKLIQNTLIKKHEAAPAAEPTAEPTAETTAETTADSQSSAHQKNE